MIRAVKLPRQSEKSFAAQVDQLATLCGWKLYKTWTSIHSPSGFPDRVFVRPPRLLFVELKRIGGKTTAAQHAWLALLCGCPPAEVYVWTPDSWTEIEKVLAR